jgi:two-component system sensor histidine kinase KdpD
MNARERGRLKIFLGYAAGVGKTYMMLEEAHVLKSNGTDVVIGYFEPHGRKDTIAKAAGLEMVPRQAISYRGALFQEMDTAAILGRKPQVCLVDELAHTNVPGSVFEKRWQDVEVLREAGIHILTTLNIQHLESLNDKIRQITGITVRETLPDWVVQQADDIVVVDLTPGALLHRLERGAIYDPGKAESARHNFFRESNLVALRELALRETAHELEHRAACRETTEPAEMPAAMRRLHKILVLVTAEPQSAMLIRRARRMGDFLQAECFAVAFQPTAHPGGRMAAGLDKIQRHLSFARNLRMTTGVIPEGDVARGLVEYARQNQITQIFLARPRTRQRLPWFSGDLIQKIVALARDMQIVIVSDHPP